MILGGIFPLHFMLNRGNLDFFSSLLLCFLFLYSRKLVLIIGADIVKAILIDKKNMFKGTVSGEISYDSDYTIYKQTYL